MSDTGRWLYAVTRRADTDALAALPGVAGEMPRVVEEDGLAAVVGDVPLDEFDEQALYRNLEDLDWLAGVARAHDTVVAAVAAGGPVVPIRLATVYHDDDRVRATLREHAADFTGSLERVTGRTEWGVKVFAEPVAEATATEAGSSRRGAGTTYLARRRAALSWRETQDRRAAEQADRVYRRLAALAAAGRTHPPQNRALAGDNRRMLGNLSYLVDDEATSAFTETVAACDADNDAIKVEITGPWPPYSFATLEEP